jgi:hypothetical protein|tara:strand:+ start:19 stop:252 length:234 start_codon:yes stop_codon:yes gene_type:complete
MEHENRGEVNAKDNQSTQEERGIIDIHNEITKAINDLIKEENPNNKGQDDYDKNYRERNDFISEDFYNSQSEGRDIQ